MALVSKAFGDIITFTRASGATWTNAAGNLVGVDFSATSNTIGTGSKTFTLSATAGVNRSWASGDSVLISDQSNSANNMTGTVTSYTAATQTLVVNVTSTGGSGTIASWRVGSLMPRFDYDPVTLAAKGLLIEEQRVNLLTYSEDFSNAAWTKTNASVTSNATVAPDGATTADKLVEDATTNFHRVQQTVTATNATHTYSVYLKAGERTSGALQIYDGVALATRALAYFDLTAGTVSLTTTGTASIQNAGNGWYRCSVVTSVALSAGSALAWIYPTIGTNQTYTGDGTSGIFIWGAQLEAGAFATSYIPTVASQVTRTPDQASVNTLSPWYNATEGTLYAEGLVASTTIPTSRILAEISDGTSSNRTQLFNASGVATLTMFVASGGVTQVASLNSGAISANTVFKFAGAYKASDFAASGNGASPTTQASGLVPVGPTNMRIGMRFNDTFQINGHLRRITYYPRRLSNAELQAITA
jgi:predicted hotdog family 3-hydroxylacyl-ACP dehydratase